MPFIQIKISGAGNSALAENVARRVVVLTHRHLHKDPALTAVAVEFVPAEQWFVAGKSLQAQKTRSFYLQISITDETNTKDEKAAYLAAVFALMNELLVVSTRNRMCTWSTLAARRTATAASRRNDVTCLPRRRPSNTGRLHRILRRHLLRRNTALFDDARPLRDFVANDCADRLGRASERLDPLCRQLVFDIAHL